MNHIVVHLKHNFFNKDIVVSQLYLTSLMAQWQRLCLQHRRRRRQGFDLWIRKVPWGRKWQPTPVCLPGGSHGQRSLTGYSSWGHKESDTT